MKNLILKGLGKAKVKKIIKNFILEQFAEYIEFNHGQTFELHPYCIVEGYGLTELPDGEDFTLDELVEFAGINKKNNTK